MLQPSEEAVAALGGAEAADAVKAATLMTLFSSPGEMCKATRLVVQVRGGGQPGEGGRLGQGGTGEGVRQCWRGRQ